MAEQYTVQYLRDCRGIDTSLPDEQIPDGSLAYGTENVVPYPGGRYNLIKRLGIRQAFVSSTADTLVGSFHTGLSGTTFYTDHGSSAFYIKDDYGQVLSTVASNYVGRACWRSFASADIVVCPAVAAKSTDSTAFITIANIPAGATAIESYNRYLFCIGHSANSLRWSAIGDPETWSETNEYLFDLGSDQFYAIHRNDTDLIVFADEQFHVLNGFGPTFQVIALNHNIGCRCNQSVVNTPYGMFFWSYPLGVAWIRGSYYSIDLPLQRKLPSVSPRTYDNVAAIYLDRDKCVRFYCFNDTNYAHCRIDFYPEKDALYYHTGRGTAATAAVVVAGSVFIGGHSSTSTGATYYEVPPSQIALYDNPMTDAGTTITATVVTKRMAMASPTAVKIIGTVMPQVELSQVTTVDGSIVMKVLSDNNTSAAREFTITPAATGIIEQKYGVNLTTRKTQIQLVDTIAGPLSFYNMITESGELAKQL